VTRPLFVVATERHVERLASASLRAVTRQWLFERLASSLIADVAFATPVEARMALAGALLSDDGAIDAIDAAIATLRESNVEEAALIDLGAGTGPTADRATMLARAMREMDARLLHAGLVDGRRAKELLASVVMRSEGALVTKAIDAIELQARWIVTWTPADARLWRALDAALSRVGGRAHVELASFDRRLDPERERDPLEIVWDDLAETDAFFFFGQNPGSNSPRFLRPLKELKDRGGKIVTFNPVIEQGLVSFLDPQNPIAMLTGKETKISDQYHQLKAGGDVAAILGLCKFVVEADDAATAAGRAEVIDHAFVKQHTTGFDGFIQSCRTTSWAEIEQESGLTEAALREAGSVYIAAEKVIAVYGMGLTQHTHGTLNVAMLVNLLLLRGNIGRPGAGCCPVRGHSNVQGQRTVGIAEKTKLVPFDKLKDLFGFDPPTEDGMNIVEAVQGLFEGKVKAFVSLGGNLVRAVPDQKRMEAAWAAQDLTVMVSTKLNRSHLFPAKHAYILPCLGRFEADEQAGGRQTVTTEDSFSMISASIGERPPASGQLRSELAIVAGLAKAAMPPLPSLKWDDWTADYALVRDLIERTYPEDFRDFNRRLYEPGGFYRGNGAHERVWKTPAGKALFTTADQRNALGFEDAPGRFRLITLRSNDQFNTTIYGLSDRLRGLEGSRDIVLMCPEDITAAALTVGQTVTLVTDVDDGHDRRLGGLTLTAFNLPRGTIAGYYPECNVLVPLSHHDVLSQTPASKSVPVRVEAG